MNHHKGYSYTTCSNQLSKSQLLSWLKVILNNNISHDFISSLKTKNGNTQAPERIYIAKIKHILSSHGFKFNQAGTQKPKDLRDIYHLSYPSTKITMEVKKTDSKVVIFNDTLPRRGVEYMLIHTKKPQLIFVDGSYFSDSSPWVSDYLSELNVLRDKYCRGVTKKHLKGCMGAYARPTFNANISQLIR